MERRAGTSLCLASSWIAQTRLADGYWSIPSRKYGGRSEGSSMRALAECLRDYAEQHFRAAIARDPEGFVRPVLVGPPDAALRELFSLLTANGRHDWQVPGAAPGTDVVVLLVDAEPLPSGAALSRG